MDFDKCKRVQTKKGKKKRYLKILKAVGQFAFEAYFCGIFSVFFCVIHKKLIGEYIFWTSGPRRHIGPGTGTPSRIFHKTPDGR